MRITDQLVTTVSLLLAAVVASAQTAKPTQPAKPEPSAQTAKPTQPAKPEPSAKPTQPVKPEPSAQTAKPPQPAKPAQPRATPSRVIVRDRSGTPLRDVRVTVSSPARQDLVTDATGSASLGTMPDGSYRLRFERDGFITLEREVSIRSAQPSTIEVALSLAPPSAPPPAPPPAEPPPPPPPVVVTVPSPRLTSVPSGPPAFFSIPDFLTKNYIGREPLKESVLACLADSTTRVLQLHDAIGEHTHVDMDEVLYVVAGEGTIRARGEATTVTAGALSVIPHGVAHALERRGKNPLMVLSMLSGAPCPLNVPAPAAGRKDR
jgi:carboxypeptidase family protein/cupin domain